MFYRALEEEYDGTKCLYTTSCHFSLLAVKLLVRFLKMSAITHKSAEKELFSGLLIRAEEVIGYHGASSAYYNLR